MRAISVVVMPVDRPMSRLRVSSSITTSSSDALPARSPMPLIAHLDLARARLHAREGVGDGEPEVVVAVRGQHDVAQAGHELVQAGEEGGVLLRHRVADGVRDVDRRRALVDRDLDDLGGELDVGARGVHRRELDVLDERAGVGDGGARLRLDVLARGHAAGARCGCPTSR